MASSFGTNQLASSNPRTERVKKSLQTCQLLREDNRRDLLELLSSMEADLQAKELSIGALQSQCLKYVLFHASHSNTRDPAGAGGGSGGVAPASPWQDPLLALTRDQSHCRRETGTHSSGGRRVGVGVGAAGPGGSRWSFGTSGLHASPEALHTQLLSVQTISAQQKASLNKMLTCLRDSEAQRQTLLKEVHEWRHRRRRRSTTSTSPTLTLNRQNLNLDTDDQVEVENGNEKEQEEMSPDTLERLKKDLASEKQKLLDQQLEVVNTKNLLKDEQQEKLQLVLLLIQDRQKFAGLYLEEKKRSGDLARLLRDEKSKIQRLANELAEESQRSLSMETEVEHYLRQLAKQREDSQAMLAEEKRQRTELEEALRRARQESEHVRKQLAEAHRVAMSQASVAVAVAVAQPQPQSQPTSSSTTLAQQPSIASTYSPGMTGTVLSRKSAGGSVGISSGGSVGYIMQQQQQQQQSASPVSTSASAGSDHAKGTTTTTTTTTITKGIQANKIKEDASKEDNSDNGFFRSLRGGMRSKQELQQQQFYSSPVGSGQTNSGRGTVLDNNNLGAGAGAVVATSAANANATLVAPANKQKGGNFKGVASGVPPPIPPNKPTIPIYKHVSVNVPPQTSVTAVPTASSSSASGNAATSANALSQASLTFTKAKTSPE